MDENIIEQVIANITATSEVLEKYYKDPNSGCSSFAASVLERMNWELNKKANDLIEINYFYAS